MKCDECGNYGMRHKGWCRAQYAPAPVVTRAMAAFGEATEASPKKIGLHDDAIIISRGASSKEHKAIYALLGSVRQPGESLLGAARRAVDALRALGAAATSSPTPTFANNSSMHSPATGTEKEISGFAPTWRRNSDCRSLAAASCQPPRPSSAQTASSPVSARPSACTKGRFGRSRISRPWLASRRSAPARCSSAAADTWERRALIDGASEYSCNIHIRSSPNY